MKQLQINFEPSITEAYNRATDYVAARIHQQHRPQKSIAADMDLSPSQLSQKLGSIENSSARFTLDNLEDYVSCTGDVEPLLYLVAKYIDKGSEDDLRKQIDALQAQLKKVG